VWVSDVQHLKDALAMVHQVGHITQSSPFADDIARDITERFAALKPEYHYRTLYLIWRKPYMAVGKNTFVDDMLMRCGLINCLETDRYPELQAEDIRELNPEVVLLSSEPYPFKEQHMAQIKRLLPNANVQLVDGEPFSWYGSRILNSVSYFHRLLNLLP
jgi:ABC-type Fe3+-hydroxamate transport system substrate-binding protein